jgi:hypothetical protein
MSDAFEFDGQAVIAPLYMMIPGEPPRVRLGVRSLSAPDWTAEVLDDEARELPETAKVTLSGADADGTSRDGWSAQATCAKSPDGSRKMLLQGQGPFKPPA